MSSGVTRGIMRKGKIQTLIRFNRMGSRSELPYRLNHAPDLLHQRRCAKARRQRPQRQ
jgi:hypothetical protein